MNRHFGEFSSIVHNRQGLKSQSHSESPLKWTLILLHFAEFSSIAHTRQGLKSQSHSKSPLKWTLMLLNSPLQRTSAISPALKCRAGGNTVRLAVESKIHICRDAKFRVSTRVIGFANILSEPYWGGRGYLRVAEKNLQ